MQRWIRSGRTPSFKFEPQSSQEPFYQKLQPQQVFVPTAPPAPTPAPGPTVSITTHLNPTDSYIVDFHFDRLRDRPDECYVVGNFTRDEMIVSDQGPSALMTRVYMPLDIEAKPDLRWIHVPWNSMQDTETLMKKICVDIGLKEEAVSSSILSNDKWDDLLHHMESVEGVSATYMQTTCLEISLSKELVESPVLISEAESGKSEFNHRGANMVLFMPFLHWGREDILEWRSEKIKQFKDYEAKHGHPPRPTDLNLMLASEASAEKKFYAEMMATQLFSQKKPLHLRRTLDQWYYSTTCDTARKRDNDQIVSKFGPENDETGRRPIIAVDQLWLWILGGNTVITCFDRRWSPDETFQCNIVDKMISWTLKQEARHIRSQYELTHLIINEVSGFFFNYSSTLNPAYRFHEIFKSAISKLNNEQAEVFQKLVSLIRDGPIWNQPRDKQDEIFALKQEFKLVEDVRDLVDELSMIARVYEDQSSIIDALADFQYYDALFLGGVTDEEGNSKKDKKNKKKSERKKGEGEDGEKEGTHEEDEESSSNSHLPVNWDPRDWFRRTKRLIYKYQEMVDGMIVEASQISDSLQNTIGLKQNLGSLFEAHASRKEAEAIMVFTLVSSCILPLSFFTSIFGMNVAELNGENPVTLRIAMAYIIPLSVLLLAFFLGVAFKRDVRERVDGWINDIHYRKKATKKEGHGEEGLTYGTQSSAANRPSVRRRWWRARRGDDIELASGG